MKGRTSWSNVKAKKKAADDFFESNEEIQKFQEMKKEEQKKAAAARGVKRKSQDTDAAAKKTKPDWKVVRAEAKLKKQKREEYKKGGSEKYTLGIKCKQVWEELRLHNCKGNKKEELCKQLWNLIKGKVNTLIYSHDTVRVIETLMAAGDEKYRTALFEEIKDEIVELCKNKYSRFFVLKILRYGTRPQKDFVIQSFKGKTHSLMKNKIACNVVELAYNDYANAKQRALMIQEFYGPYYRLFPDENIHCLQDAIKAKPEREVEILKDLQGTLQPIVEKGIFTNTMIHTLLRDYLTYCSAADRTAMIEGLREHLLPIVHTRDGARVAMICLWHGMAKDRKVILRSFKNNLITIAKDPQAYMVLLAAFDCVDDTALLNNLVIKILMENIADLVATDAGLRILRYIVSPRDPRFFQPAVIDQLKVGDGNPASKKPADVRQKEIQAGASDGILSFLSGNLETWAFNANWTLFIASALETLSGSYIGTVFNQLANLCAVPYEEGIEDHFLEVAHTSKMITIIIKADKQRYENDKLTFTEILLKTVGENLCSWIESNRGCFMLVSIIETEISKYCESIKKMLSPHKGRLKELTTPGGKILCQKLKEMSKK